MEIGYFFEETLKNVNYHETIKKIDRDINLFLYECFICDLIYIYSKTGNIVEIASKDIIPIYYEIANKYSNVFNDKYNEISVSTGYKNIRIAIRNAFSSNSDSEDGLQNRREIEYRKEGRTNIYKLSNEILNFNLDSLGLNKIIFNERFKYLYNFRKYFVKKSSQCSCGISKHLFINIKNERLNKIPLPIHSDIEYKCSKCILDKNLNGLNNFYN